MSIILGFIFELLGELILWFIFEVVGAVVSPRVLLYIVSLLLIALYVIYRGADQPATWFRAALMLAVLLLVDNVITPWLRRRFGRAKLEQ